jgi:hypothetical protein
VGSEGAIPHKGGRENKRKSQFKICSILMCLQSRTLFLLRYRTRAFHMIAGGHDVREGTHAEEVHEILTVQT